MSKLSAKRLFLGEKTIFDRLAIFAHVKNALAPEAPALIGAALDTIRGVVSFGWARITKGKVFIKIRGADGKRRLLQAVGAAAT